MFNIKLFAILFIFALSWPFTVNSQSLLNRSFYIVDDIDHTPLAYAQMRFTKIADTSNKLYTLRANSAGILEISTASSNDSIRFTIKLNGYKAYQGTAKVKSLFLKTIGLVAKEHFLSDVTVSSNKKKIRYQPGSIKISWNKYSKSMGEPLGEVIKRIPVIISKSLGKNHLSLRTIGDKKVVVYLDGRKLSDQEVMSLPSMMIAKASLVTFASALDADANTAVLYLSSKMFAYKYSFEDIRLSYDIGRTGPSFTFRHTQKNGLWSNNIMVNGYGYKMPKTTSQTHLNNTLFQQDDTKSNSNAITLLASLTKKTPKNNLFTVGILSNLYKGSAQGQHHQLQPESKFKSNYDASLIKTILYASWYYRRKQGGAWRLYGSGSFTPINKWDYLNTDISSVHSFVKNTDQIYSLSAKHYIKKIKYGHFEWNNNIAFGLKRTNNRIEQVYNQVYTLPSITSTKENSVYGGLSTILTSDKFEFQGSMVANYANQSGYQFSKYNHSYIYPKLSFAYTPDDQQSFSLALTASTLRPNLKMAMSDSTQTSNWTINTGNQSIKAEHNYNVDFLYNFTKDNFTLETELQQIYYSNGIVESWKLIQEPNYQLISTYHNVDYFDRSMSILVSYQIGASLYIKGSGQIHHLAFRQTSLPDDYEKGFYLKMDGNVNYYTKKIGNFALLLNWDGNPLHYLKKTKTHPELGLDYNKDISKNLNLGIGLHDIFASGDWKDSRIYEGFNRFTNANGRTLSLTLSWKIGQMFSTLMAGSANSSAIPQDTKAL